MSLKKRHSPFSVLLSDRRTFRSISNSFFPSVTDCTVSTDPPSVTQAHHLETIGRSAFVFWPSPGQRARVWRRRPLSCLIRRWPSSAGGFPPRPPAERDTGALAGSHQLSIGDLQPAVITGSNVKCEINST